MDRLEDSDGKHLRIHQSIARQLAIEILSGIRLPGDSFGGEIEQSAALGVSRTAYREAIRILIAKGLLESRPKAGTSVTPRARWNLLDPDVLEWTFSGNVDEGFIRNLFELREIIEPAAAALAAQRRSPDQLEQMRLALAAMRAHGLASELGQAGDQQFHRLILEAAGNDALATLSSSVEAAVRWTTRFKQRHHALPRDPVPEHEALIEAIAAGSVRRAKGCMKELLRLALCDLGIVMR